MRTRPVNRSVEGVLLGAALFGCGPKKAPLGPPITSTLQALAPGASPGKRATLRLGAPPTDERNGPSAMEFEVGIVRTVEGSETSFKLITGGETIERETYESSPGAFRLVSTGEDTFVPPLDVMRFPVRDGETWDWRGKVVYAGRTRDASARLTAKRDGEDVRSDVALTIVASEGGRRDRRLTLWFRKGQGVVARQFGNGSSRRPVGEPWRP